MALAPSPSQRRIVVTFNVKHFTPLAGTRQDAGIIAVTPHWQSNQVDTKMTALLMQHNPTYFKGQVRRLGAEKDISGSSSLSVVPEIATRSPA